VCIASNGGEKAIQKGFHGDFPKEKIKRKKKWERNVLSVMNVMVGGKLRGRSVNGGGSFRDDS